MKIVQGLQLIALALALAACGRSTPIMQQQFDPGVYIVQTGDTVYSISWRYNQDFRNVIRWNKLGAPYTIFPGQKLSVRGAAGSPAPAGVQPSSNVVAGADNSGSTAAKTHPLKKPSAPASKITAPPASADTGSAPVSGGGKNNWVWPAKGKLLSRFSASAVNRQGIDIAGVEGAPVVASRGGKVVYSGSGMPIYGPLIIIKHNETFLSAYAHNSQLLVGENDTIKTGQTIARIGVSNQGVAKLHFEIRKNGKPVNPLKYLPNN